MTLEELYQIIAENSEKGQRLKFYDATPGLLDMSGWNISPKHSYQIGAAKPRLFHHEAVITFREDDERGVRVTRELLLDFMEELASSSHSWDDNVGILLFADSASNDGARYLTGLWAKMEVKAPGVFALFYGEDTAPPWQFVLDSLAKRGEIGS